MEGGGFLRDKCTLLEQRENVLGEALLLLEAGDILEEGFAGDSLQGIPNFTFEVLVEDAEAICVDLGRVDTAGWVKDKKPMLVVLIFFLDIIIWLLFGVRQ